MTLCPNIIWHCLKSAFSSILINIATLIIIQLLLIFFHQFIFYDILKMHEWINLYLMSSKWIFSFDQIVIIPGFIARRCDKHWWCHSHFCMHYRYPPLLHFCRLNIRYWFSLLFISWYMIHNNHLWLCSSYISLSWQSLLFLLPNHKTWMTFYAIFFPLYSQAL